MTNAAGDVQYIEGSDYIVDLEAGRIIRASEFPDAGRETGCDRGHGCCAGRASD